MSGLAHTVLLQRSDVRYLSMVRQAQNVEAIAVPSPSSPFLRVPAALFLENNGIRVHNPSAGSADVGFVLDTPRGTYVIDEFTVGPGGTQTVSLETPVIEGESIRAFLFSTSDPGAAVEIQVRYGDMDTISKIVTPLVPNEYTTVLEAKEGEVIPLIAIGVEVDPGVPMDFDMQILKEDGTVISTGITTGFNAGFVTPISAFPPTIVGGQKLQVRTTAGTGSFLVLPMHPNPDFYAP